VQAKHALTLLGELRVLTNDQSSESISSHMPGGNTLSNGLDEISSEVKLLYPIYHCRGLSAISFDLLIIFCCSKLLANVYTACKSN